MEFIEANIAKFYDFLSQIIKNSNDAKGIIATLSNQRIRVIYDYKYIHDDYGNFDCAELYDKQIAYHYFVYELNKEKDSNFLEQTIDNFNFVSKYNNIITLRITMENVKQLYFMLRDSKLTALQLKAENYNNYKIFSEEKTENSKYKTILSIKDINEDSTINTVSSNLSILIKAVKKPFDIFNRDIGEVIVSVPYNLNYIKQMCKIANNLSLSHFFLELTILEDKYQFKFIIKDLTKITVLKNEAGTCPFQGKFIINTEDLLSISDKINLTIYSEDYLVISEKFLEIRMKFYDFQDIEPKKDNPYMVKSFSIPITMLNANQNEEDYN